MEKESMIFFLLFLSLATLTVQGKYYSDSVVHVPAVEKKTELHFFLHDILSGNNPTAVMVAHSDRFPVSDKNPVPFGSTFVIDDPLTEGPELTSKVIGNARGAYIATSQHKDFTIGMMIDFGFTSGEFNGSSFMVLSRNPVSEADREVAVVGGRGKFRMARGFAKIKTQFISFTTGDAVLEYNVTLLHY